MHETPSTVNPQSPTTPKQSTLAILESVAARHQVTVKEIMSADRTWRVIAARHEAMADVVEARPDWSYPKVGRLFGKDHTTVINALQKLGRWKPRGYGPNHGGIPTASWHIGQFIASLQITWEGGAQ